MTQLPQEWEEERQQLLKRLEEQGRALEQARALERSNEDLEQFAYVASHELQEPLRKILGFADRLREECGEALGENGHDYVRRMSNAAQRMRALIRDVLAYSRVTTRPQTLFPVSLEAVAQQVLSDLEVRIEQIGARVELGELPTLHADPIEMRQLLQNLIGNALKFHRKDVMPIIKVYGSTVKDERGESYQFVVEDNGIGFDEELLPRMFMIFQRLHGRSSEYDGTGIGLAICKKIVSRHGGNITAQSTPGQGSRFVVTLPRQLSYWKMPSSQA